MTYLGFWKRALDVLLSLAVGFILLPVIALGAVLTRAALGQPVIFRAVRAGRNGRPFIMYKLRTMLDTRDDAGHLLPDSQRLHPIGNVVRGLSLDELPQLYNVLRGDMSLVGPRALLLEYVDRYTDEQRVRLQVRPGITGLAQVRGRNETTWHERLSFDSWYVKNASLLLDLWILISTPLAVVRTKSDLETSWRLGKYMGPQIEPDHDWSQKQDD